MAYTKRTIVRTMVANSGKAPEEISVGIGREEGYVSLVVSGDADPSTNTLGLIAKQCGYRLAFVGHGETLELATYQPRADERELDVEGTYSCELTGKEISFTGSVYGLGDDAQRAILRAVGASWVDKVRVRTTDILVTGTDYDPESPTRQVKSVLGAKRTVTQIMTAEEFRSMYQAITGVDIAEGGER